jgi:hypothetical protein|tara:strand:+ start:267 stop:665 length:399 start_codon:yes stop_codon:yes gene_type:complete
MEDQNYVVPMGFAAGNGRKLTEVEKSLNVRLLDKSRDDYATFENCYVELITPGSKECGVYQGTTETGNIILSPYISNNYTEKEDSIIVSQELTKNPLMVKRDSVLQIRQIKDSDLEALLSQTIVNPKNRENN